jgi:hypothetical protein
MLLSLKGFRQHQVHGSVLRSVLVERSGRLPAKLADAPRGAVYLRADDFSRTIASAHAVFSG